MDINTPALPPISPALLQKLNRFGQILPAYHCQDLQEQELQSLLRLQLKSQPLSTKLGYLNAYDRLFRYISLALLAQGYRLTDKQPHQTLRAVAACHLANDKLGQVITLRHQLKKSNQTQVCSVCADALAQLLASYESIDPQACQNAKKVPSTL